MLVTLRGHGVKKKELLSWFAPESHRNKVWGGGGNCTYNIARILSYSWTKKPKAEIPAPDFLVPDTNSTLRRKTNDLLKDQIHVNLYRCSSCYCLTTKCMKKHNANLNSICVVVRHHSRRVSSPLKWEL